MELFNANIFVHKRIKPENLIIGQSYPLEKLERVNTEFGEGIVAKIKQDDESVIIFLPGYFTTKLTAAAIEEINSKKDIDLVYNGPSVSSHKYYLRTRAFTA